jgi:hypothetical protein
MTQEIDLTQFAEAVNNAYSNIPCVLATADDQGNVDAGVKGSMMVFDKEHLAYWERTRGTHLENLRKNSKVAVVLFSREPRAYLRFFGDAQIHDGDDMREQIMSRTVQNELDRDPERKGYGVLIKVNGVMAPPRPAAPPPTTGS